MLSEISWKHAALTALVASGLGVGPPIEPERMPAPATLPPRAAPPAVPDELIEMLPGVRINRAKKLVEFDGTVAMDCHDPQTPHVYLEVIVTTPDNREHEALVVTSVKPSLVHAGLLAVGSAPGVPGRFERGPAGRPTGVPPTGTAVDVELVTRDAEGKEVVAKPEQWMVHVRDKSHPKGLRWLHGGSRMVQRTDPATGRARDMFDADGTGQLVGLHTFGSEVVSLATVLNPEAAVEEPIWIADARVVPKFRSPVTVRLTLHDEKQDAAK